MEPITLYRQLLAGIGALIILHSIFCQASPIPVRREVACLVNAPSAIVPQDSMPNWQIPGDCLFSIMETQTTQYMWCDQPVTTVLSSATYCCPAYRHCTEEYQERIQCNGFWDTSREFQKLADDLQMLQANLLNIGETAKQNVDEVPAIIATAITKLPGCLAELNKTVENISMSLDILDAVASGD